MIRRLPPDAAVRKPDGDAELLRIVASAANEIVDVLDLPGEPGPRLERVAQRYARTLRLDRKAVQSALQEARDALRKGGAAAPDDVPEVPHEAAFRASAAGRASAQSRAGAQ
jgi:non-specific serine/threonine protein kinase